MFQYDREFLTGKLYENIHGRRGLFRLAQSYGL